VQSRQDGGFYPTRGRVAQSSLELKQPRLLFFGVCSLSHQIRICFCSRSGFILCEFGYLFSVSPAYQHVCLPKPWLAALWIHINKLLLLY
jgi:hypothetical protein